MFMGFEQVMENFLVGILEKSLIFVGKRVGTLVYGLASSLISCQ